MVSEIILCVKERNKQTRATSFELLVQIAHAMHDAESPPPGLDYAMADGERLVICLGMLPTPCSCWLDQPKAHLVPR